MSQAAVGQRSAHNPQCRHTSSSLTITRVVGSSEETYKSWDTSTAGAFSRARSSPSSPLAVNVIQDVGHMSIHASHSIHLLVLNTVWTSQFRQRCASLNPSIFFDGKVEVIQYLCQKWLPCHKPLHLQIEQCSLPHLCSSVHWWQIRMTKKESLGLIKGFLFFVTFSLSVHKVNSFWPNRLLKFSQKLIPNLKTTTF